MEIEMNVAEQLTGVVQEKDERRNVLLVPGWLAVFALSIMLVFGVPSVFNTKDMADGGHLIALAFFAFMGFAVYIFWKAVKGIHLPWLVLVPYSFIMPLGFYFMVLKWYDGRR